MKAKIYETPAAFKRALEDRLKAGSKTGVDFALAQLAMFLGIDEKEITRTSS